MQVQNVMTRQVHSCGPEDSLEYAAQLMWNHDCGCLPVCQSTDEGASRTIGLITDRDICMCALLQRKALSELQVSEAMAKPVLSCQPDASLEHAESIMRDARIRRLPVTNEDGALLGLISLADLARQAAQNSVQRQAEVQLCGTLAAICTPRELSP